MEEIFAAAVKLLAAKGYARMENYFVDGTKTGSAGGRYWTLPRMVDTIKRLSLSKTHSAKHSQEPNAP